MHNSKLLRVLRQFTKSERKSLFQFINSPYLNSNQKVTNLLNYLLEMGDKYLNDESDVFDRTIIWRKVSADEKYNYTYLRKITSDSLRLIEEFMIQEQLKKDVNIKTHLLLENSIIRENKLYQNIAIERFEQNKRLFFKRRNSVNIYTSQILKNLFILKEFDKTRYEESGINEIIFEVDKFFITEKLKLLCDLLSRNWELDVSGYEFFTQILQVISKEEFKVPAIQAYYYIYMTIEEPENVEHYFKLKDLIILHYSEFDEYEAKSIFDATVSYGIAKVNKGELNFLNEVLLLYKAGLSKSIITYNNKIDPYHFKIIVMTGLRLSEFDWVEYFIEEYKELIPLDEKQNVISYNLAQLNFYKKDYNKVLTLLQEIEYEDLTYNLGAKSMLLATYYELEEFEPLFSFLDSFKVYLNRKKQNIPKNFIDAYLNLIKFTRRLVSMPLNDKVKLEKFENDLKATQDVASVKWLLEKIEQLR